MIEQIGSHVVRHGDLMDGLAELMGEDRADVVYTDPPWGQGNLRYWQTMNTKMTGAQKKDIEFSAFLDTLFREISRYALGPVLMEYGTRWEKDIIRQAEKHGFGHFGQGVAQYVSGNRRLPLHLHLFGQIPLEVPDGYFQALEGTHGFETVRRAMTPFAVPGGIVLDPACGLGLTARAARETGMRFRGNEINDQRLEKTKRVLRGA